MTDVLFTAIDHIQLAMPVGGEETARHFYVEVLSMIEAPKPRELAKRGGCWFQSGTVQVHLGVEHDFHPVRKAHPAFRCRNYEAAFLISGAPVSISARWMIFPGVCRGHIHDPFGNRIELIAA